VGLAEKRGFAVRLRADFTSISFLFNGDVV
jgi:hypothetical protein